MFCERDRRGLTLIELLVALAMASLLMAATIGVLRGVSIQVHRANPSTHVGWEFVLAELLRRDLAVAEKACYRDGILWLEGEFEPIGFDTRQEIRRVGYACHALGAVSLLARSTENSRGDIAVGPSRILVERIDSAGVCQPLSGIPGPAPSHIRVWVRNNGETHDEVMFDVIAYL
jgi:prepilin-type N-terminal cleavage/methylation domain-containing protein